MKKIIITILALSSFLINNSIAQTDALNIAEGGILIDYEGNSAIHPSALLQLNSDNTATKGFLMPRIANATSIASPATGLMVYQTGGTPGFYYYDGSAWRMINNIDNDFFIKNQTGIQSPANFNIDGIGTIGTTLTLTGVSGNIINATNSGVQTIALSNDNITNVNHITIADPGPNEGIAWNSSSGWVIDVSPLDRANSAGNLNLYGTGNNIALWRPSLFISDVSNYTTATPQTNGGLHFTSTGSGHITFDPGGNVGIGHSSAIRKLDILTTVANENGGMVVRSATGASNVAGHLWAGTGGFVIDARLGNLTGAANLHLRTGGSDRVHISSTGTVRLVNYTTNGLLKTTSGNGTLAIATPGTDYLTETIADNQYVKKTGDAMTGKLTLANTFPNGEGVLNLPNIGTANPANSVNGDIWFRSNTLFFNNNGTARQVAHTSSWSAMSVAEGQTATATTSRFMRSDFLKQIIEYHSPNVTLAGENYLTLSGQEITANQITSAHILDGTIAAVDIANNAVTTAKINNNAVTTAKIAANAVNGTKIQLGSDAAGDIMYYNGTDYVRLPAGGAGTLLQSNGVAAPSWANPTTLGDNLGNHTATTTLNLSNNNITNVNLLSGRNVASYDKIRVWNSNLYTIGMMNGHTVGYINNEYAMTFTMNNAPNRGFLWRDSDDAANDGAMSLTTDGRLWLKSTAHFNGNVGIGTNNPTYNLHVIGRIRSNAINETSDMRLKTDITQLTNALEKIQQLRGVSYKWRTEEFPDMKLDQGLQHGLIAQELEKVIPELVHTDSEGWKSIEYSHMVPLLIEAIKEQQTEIKRLAHYADKVEKLEALLDELNTGLNHKMPTKEQSSK